MATTTSLDKSRLVAHEGATLNAETPLHLLEPALTPVENFFVRNNGVWPDLPPGDPEAWSLTVGGSVAQPRRWRLSELKAEFEVVSLSAVLECAGNGRAMLDPPVEGVAWGLGAVGCARFTGVRLRDILSACEPLPEAVYTAHHSPDRTAKGAVALSRGLPLWKAAAPETLLAFAMNDAPLPFEHGGPLRVVAPGFPGSAWQKWVNRIDLRDRVHDGAKMNGLDYRLPEKPLAPDDDPTQTSFGVIEDMPVRSIITAPSAEVSLRTGAPIEVAGWAWAGRIPVTAVHISTDGGRSWGQAELASSEERWAWRRFRWTGVANAEGPIEIIARASDAVGRSQPLSAHWNPRGYCNNACHRVELDVV